MNSVYNKFCVMLLVLASFASMICSAYLCVKYIWVQEPFDGALNIIMIVGILIGALFTFFGQFNCFFSLHGKSIWVLTREEDEVFAVLNKQVIKRVLISPFVGMYLIIQMAADDAIWIIAVVPVVLFSLLVCLPQFLVLAAITAAICLITYAIFSVLRLMDGDFYRTHIKMIVCDKCGKKIDDYDLLCPKCNYRFEDILVSQYGSTTRLCPKCHETLFVCPNKKFKQCNIISNECPHVFNSNAAQPITISLAGTPGCGKTSYISSFRSSMIDIDFVPTDINVSPNALSGPTPMGYLDPVVMEFTDDKLINAKRLYFYDINGKEFTVQGNRDYFQKQYSYSSGLIFMIDGELIDGYNEKGLKQTEDTFDGFMTCLRNISKTKTDGRFDIPLAIVLTKVDRMSDDVTIDTADSYLRNSDLISMMNSIDKEFKNHRVFTCDNTMKKGVLEPTDWIIGFDCKKMSKIISAKRNKV